MLRTLTAGVAVTAAMFGAPLATAETGPNPTHDFRCYNAAYAHGSHLQGGVRINHAKQHCADAVMPPDYGSGNPDLSPLPSPLP